MTPVWAKRVAISACLAACLAAGAQVHGQSNTIDLKYVSGGPAGSAMTPRTVLAAPQSLPTGGASHVTAGGTRLKLSGQTTRQGLALGVDCDGDGHVRGKEVKVIRSKTRRVAFDLKLPDRLGVTRDYSIAFASLRVAGGRLTGLLRVNCSMEATYKGTTIRLLDDNLDGRFTQDGSDAILIGKATVAVPLREVHKIGGAHYRLEVTADAAELTLTELKDTDLSRGIVSLPPRPALRCLVVKGPVGSSYDLKADGPTGVPPGKHLLCYGVLSVGKKTVLIKPGPGGVAYTISADKPTRIPVGGPLKVDFDAGHHDGKITIGPKAHLVGAGGEVYHFARDQKLGTAKVKLISGKKTVWTMSAALGQGGFRRTYVMPAPKTIAADSVVQVTITVRGLGPAKGSRTLAEITPE